MIGVYPWGSDSVCLLWSDRYGSMTVMFRFGT